MIAISISSTNAAGIPTAFPITLSSSSSSTVGGLDSAVVVDCVVMYSLLTSSGPSSYQ